MKGASAPGQADRARLCPVEPAPRTLAACQSSVAWGAAGYLTCTTELQPHGGRAVTCKRPTRRPSRIRAALLLACAVTASCASSREADEQEAVEAAFSFTFEDGAEGWTAGFAGLSRRLRPVDLRARLRAPPPAGRPRGPRPLHPGAQPQRRPSSCSSRGRSAASNPTRSTPPSSPWTLATNVAESLVGIGGSPGESVFVKAGASTVEPVTPEDDAGYFRMNIDKGNQSNGGESMVVVGHVAHPAVAGGEYRLKSPRQLRPSGEGHRRRRGPAVADRRHRLRVRRAERPLLRPHRLHPHTRRAPRLGFTPRL